MTSGKSLQLSESVSSSLKRALQYSVGKCLARGRLSVNGGGYGDQWMPGGVLYRNMVLPCTWQPPGGSSGSVHKVKESECPRRALLSLQIRVPAQVAPRPGPVCTIKLSELSLSLKRWKQGGGVSSSSSPRAPAKPQGTVQCPQPGQGMDLPEL